ncbi:flagellar basal body-associated FliL family protein [Parvibaculum lavamentivorans]|nr:flagellar basal body-associated FliL family protein [Rhodobiaceae bacterium]MBN4051814.1 flagellar basal body-associated FliL family protein [Parvibaculum lavamentivorans]
MSDTDIDFDDSAGDGEEGSSKKLSGKVMVLFIALPAIVVIGGIVGALFAFGVFGGGDEDMAMMEVEEEERVPPVFFDMPEILVNMSTNSGPSRYLKMRVALEVPDEDAIAEIELVMPRVVDSFQVYLRELRPEDMEGSASIVRMKEELLRRVNLAVEPIHINDVLFKEVVVQ